MADLIVTPFGWERAALAAEKVTERLKRSTAALEQAGVAYAVVGGNAVAEWVGRVDEDASAIRLLFAGEPVRVGDPATAPDVDESEPAAGFRVVSLRALVQIKLTSFRLKDRVHLQDLIGVGQIDQTWPARLPPVLAARLQEILDNPDG